MIQKKHKGYLLIELMIALLLIISSSVVIGKFLGLIARNHREALLNLEAANIARAIIDTGDVVASDQFKVAIVKAKPYKDVPYNALEIKLSTYVGNKEKTFIFFGGVSELPA